jgi:hypothetical protein
MKTMYNHPRCESCKSEAAAARAKASESKDGWGASAHMGYDNRSHGAIAKRTS